MDGAIGQGASRVVRGIDAEPQTSSSPNRLRLRIAGSGLHEQLRTVRRRLADWGSRAGLDRDDVDDMVLATYEALVNVADHAYPDGGGVAWLDADRRPEGIQVTVRDAGAWRPPAASPGRRGRGMAMIMSLAKRVAVVHSRAGTTVTMHWDVGQAHPS